MKRIAQHLLVTTLFVACSYNPPGEAGRAVLSPRASALNGDDGSTRSGTVETAQPGVGLEPGDVVRITVWRKPEFSGEFTIATDGTIRHPLYKEVKISGMSMAAAEERVFTFLTQYEQAPQLVLEPLFRVAVGGEVVSPNLYSLPRETTIAQAVALAGGPTERGRLNRVRILRGGSEVYADLTTPNAEWARQQVQSGDQILVSRRRNILAEVIGPLASLAAAAAAITTVLSR